MKKIIKFIKNNIFGIMIGGLIMGSVGVSASYLYNSELISYNDSDVKSALDELYEKSNKKNTIQMIDLTSVNTAKGLTNYNLKDNATLYGIDNDKYLSLTSDNFIVEYGSISAGMSVSTGGEGTAWVSTTQNANGSLSKNYNKTTGIFTTSISCSSSRRNWVNDGTVSVSASSSNVKVYLKY